MNEDPRMQTITEAIQEHLETDAYYGILQLKSGSSPEAIANAVLTALAEPMTIEYAGHHKHAGIQTVDEDGDVFDDEKHLRENFADFDNCILVSRRVTAWTALEDTK